MNDHVLKVIVDSLLVFMWMWIVYRNVRDYFRVTNSYIETAADLRDKIAYGQKLLDETEEDDNDRSVCQSRKLVSGWIMLMQQYLECRNVDRKCNKINMIFWIIIGIFFFVLQVANCINTVSHLTHDKCPFLTRYECPTCDAPVPTNSVPVQVEAEVKDGSEEKVPEK